MYTSDDVMSPIVEQKALNLEKPGAVRMVATLVFAGSSGMVLWYFC